MARKKTTADSLELLLDTICNTFGGVLFIAILVVILLQTTGERAESAPEEPVSAEYVLELALRLDAVSAELSALERLRAGQEHMAEQFAPDEIRELLKVRQSLHEELDRARSARDELVAGNARELAEMTQTQARIEEVRQSVDQAREQTAQLQLQLEEERSARKREVKLPVVHTKRGREEIGIVLRYRRAYLWHAYDQAGNRRGPNLDDFVIIESNASSIVVRPKPTAGIPLEDSPETESRIRQMLQRFSPNQHVMAIIVRPDSYEVFRFLKDVVTDMGFEYRLMPMTEDGAVQDRGGTGGRVQ